MSSSFRLTIEDKYSKAHSETYTLAILFVERENLNAIKDDQWAKSGFYLLLSDKAKNGKYTAYTGKSDKNILSRLKTHNNNKEFWTKAVLVVRDNHNGFSPSDVSWFEWKLNTILELNKFIEKDNIQKVDYPAGASTTTDEEKLNLLQPVFDFCRIVGYNLQDGIIEKQSKTSSKNNSPSKPSGHQNKVISYKSKTTVKDLVEAGLIAAGSKIVTTMKKYSAGAVINKNGEVEYDGKSYTSLSLSGIAAINKTEPQIFSTNGWTFWGIQQLDGTIKNLDSYRKEYEASNKSF